MNPELLANPLTQVVLVRVLDAVLYKSLRGVKEPPDEIALRIAQLQGQLQALQSMTGTGSVPGRSTPAQMVESPARTYSAYAPWMQVSTSCLACGRAHLGAAQAALERAAASGSSPSACSGSCRQARDQLTDMSALLKEALRFAREDGLQHPEVQKRLQKVQGDLAVLERFTLAPESASPDLEPLLPDLRQLRQHLYNGVQTPGDLTQAAARAGQLAKALWGNDWLAFADEELAALRTLDWAPETVEKAPPEEKERILPAVREVEEIHNKIRQSQNPSPDQLQELAEQIRMLRQKVG